MKILNVLKNFEEEEQEVDMLIANYVYEKVGMEHKKVTVMTMYFRKIRF